MVSVVIVNYFSETLAVDCLRSIHEAEPSLAQDMEFVIVDNGSSQDWSCLLAGLPHVKLIASGKNLGFGRAANSGIRASRGEYILLINPDSLVCEGAIGRATAFMEDPANSAVAILGPKVYDDVAKRSVQSSVRSFPGFSAGLFTRTSLMTRLWPDNPWSREFLRTNWQHDLPARVDWVSGCCMLIRRSALDQIGMFDERYFMYLEDVDLCRRARAQGWEVAYFPGTEIVHQIGASTELRPLRMIVELHRSGWLYFRKFFRAGIITRAVVLLGICARATVEIFVALVGLSARRVAGRCARK